MSDTPQHSDLIPAVTNGAENYGNWEVMEIMEKYGDKPGTFMALKHICRKPKNEDVSLSQDAVRLKDIKKAITYLQREVDLAEGKITKIIQ